MVHDCVHGVALVLRHFLVSPWWLSLFRSPEPLLALPPCLQYGIKDYRGPRPMPVTAMQCFLLAQSIFQDLLLPTHPDNARAWGYIGVSPACAATAREADGARLQLLLSLAHPQDSGCRCVTLPSWRVVRWSCLQLGGTSKPPRPLGPVRTLVVSCVTLPVTRAAPCRHGSTLFCPTQSWQPRCQTSL